MEFCGTFNSIVAILKPGKNPEESSSYRPICLLSCVRKLFEKMLQTRMDHWIEREGKVDLSQFGLKKGFGTTDCTSILATDIAEVYARKNMCSAAIMDISAAYDNVNIEILCDRLAAIECSTIIIRTIHSLFAFFVCFSVETREGYKGLAQGSTLSLSLPCCLTSTQAVLACPSPLTLKYFTKLH